MKLINQMMNKSSNISINNLKGKSARWWSNKTAPKKQIQIYKKCAPIMKTADF